MYFGIFSQNSNVHSATCARIPLKHLDHPARVERTAGIAGSLDYSLVSTSFRALPCLAFPGYSGVFCSHFRQVFLHCHPSLSSLRFRRYALCFPRFMPHPCESIFEPEELRKSNSCRSCSPAIITWTRMNTLHQLHLKFWTHVLA